MGDVDNNLNRADAVLSRANPRDLDLLVLPELAFSGKLKHRLTSSSVCYRRFDATPCDCVVKALFYVRERGEVLTVDIRQQDTTLALYNISALTLSLLQRASHRCGLGQRLLNTIA